MSQPNSIQLEDLLDFGFENKTVVSKSQSRKNSISVEPLIAQLQQTDIQKDEELLLRDEDQNDKHKHSCRHCPSSYKHRKHLNQHMRKKHPKDWEAEQEEAKKDEITKPFECNVCQEAFATYDALRQHRSRKHDENQRWQVSILKSNWKCKKCFIVCPTRADLRKHEKDCGTRNMLKFKDDIFSDLTSRTSFDSEP